MPPALTPYALEHAPLMRRLAARDFASKAELAASFTAGDVSNLNKILKHLATQGLVLPVTAELTDDGANAVRDLDRLDATEPPPPAGEEDREAVEGALPPVLRFQIFPDPDQPRKDFTSDEAKASLDELKASIVRKGLIEPIVLRPHPDRDDGDDAPTFMIIAGERRWRAIGLAMAEGGWAHDKPIPYVLRDADAAEAGRLALIENLQRKDLKPLEEAHALQRLVDAGATTAELAEEIGFSQRWVQQRLQLLQLPAIKQVELEKGKITFEDARRWLNNRPQIMELSDGQWLLLVEGAHKALAPEPDRYVQAGVERDPDYKALAALNLFYGPYADRDEGIPTGRWRISIGYNASDQLRLKFEVDLADRDALDLLAAQLRAALGLKPQDDYATPYLNGPVEIAPEVAAQIAAAKEAAAATAARRRDADAEAHRIASAALQEARRIVAKGRETPPAVADERLAESFAGAGVLLPVYVTDVGDILDSTGAQVVRSGWFNSNLPPATMARYLLIAASMNAAAGLATPDPPAPDADDVLPREEFIRVVAGCLIDDCDDLPDDEAEALFEATRRAGAGLDAFLAQEEIDYGHPQYDWEETGAMAIAQGIREDGLGEASAPATATETEAAEA